MLDANLALPGRDAQAPASNIAASHSGSSDDYVAVPDAHLLLSGEFKRLGSTGLKITGEDGKSFFIENYFTGDEHKHLIAPEGATLSAHVVEALAGPLAPGQFAQAGAQPANGNQVIGRIDALSGSCIVVRNGVSVSLNLGDPVLKGDVVQTLASSTASIVFTDGSTFSLSANARMVLDEFVYAAGGSNNSAVISLVQGTFSFIAGQVGKTGDMKVETPVGIMGISGGAVLVEISADGGTKFSVMVEPNGSTGSFNLYNKTTGALIATGNNSQIGWSVLPAGPLEVVARQVNQTPAELQQELGIVQQLFNIFNNFKQDPADQQIDPASRPAHGTGGLLPSQFRVGQDQADSHDPADPLQPGTTRIATPNVTINDGPGGSQPQLQTQLIEIIPPKNPPVAHADGVTIGEDSGPTLIDVVGNDTNDFTGPLQAASDKQGGTNFLLSDPDLGSLTYNGDGTFTFTPASDVSGIATFSYYAFDGVNYSNVPTTVTIKVNPVADQALLSTTYIDAGNSLEDTAIAVPLSAQLADTDGSETLDRVTVSGLPVGTVLSDAEGGHTFTATLSLTVVDISGWNLARLHVTPPQDFNGLITLTVTGVVTDRAANLPTDTTIGSQIIQINVSPVDDTPITNAASGSGAEDTAIAIVLSGSDVEGTLSGFTLTSLPTDGSLFYDAAGTQAVVTSGGTADITTNANSVTLYFKPAADWNGSTSLSYVAVQAGAAGNTVIAPITVTAVNDAPAGTNKTITILEDGSRVLTMADFGYSDIEGDAFASLKITSLPANGKLLFGAEELTEGYEMTAVGTLLYVPDPDANGSGIGSFTFQVRDAQGELDPTPNTITMNVSPVDDTPITNAASGSGAEDTAIAIVLSGSDIDGTLSGFRLTSLPTNGSLFYDAVGTQAVVTSGGTADITSNANSITLYFEPAADWNGSTSLSYAAVQDGAAGNTVIVPITVTAVNDAPAGTNKTITLQEDISRFFRMEDFGYSDAEGDAFASVKITSLPAHGRLVGFEEFTEVEFTEGYETANGFRFIPDQDENGIGYGTFTFQVRDAQGELDPTPNTMTINVTSVNDRPLLDGNFLIEGYEGIPTPIFLSGSDVEGPLKGFRIFAPFAPPTPEPYELPYSGSLFYDAEGTRPIEFINGTAEVTSNANSITIYFIANDAEWSGAQIFRVSAVDQTNVTSSPPQFATQRMLEVLPVNDAPVFTGDRTASVSMGESYTLTRSDLFYTDIDDWQGAIVFTVSDQSNGTIKVSGVVATTFTALDVEVGRVTFLQNGTAEETASFAFTMDDNNQDNSPPFSSTFNFDVALSARPETYAPSTATGSEDQAAAIQIVLSGSDSDGTVARYNMTSLPQHGQLFSDAALSHLITNSVVGTGNQANNYATTVYFRPDANWSGSTDLQFAAVDNFGGVDLTPASATIDVMPVVDDAVFSFGRGSVGLELNGGFTQGLTHWTTYSNSGDNFFTTTLQTIFHLSPPFQYRYQFPFHADPYALVDPQGQASDASVLQQSFLVPFALEDMKISYDFFVVSHLATHYVGDGSLTGAADFTSQFARIDVLNSGYGVYDTSPNAVVTNLFIGTTMDGEAVQIGNQLIREFSAPVFVHQEFTTGTGGLANFTSDQIYLLRFANMSTYTYVTPEHMAIDHVSIVAQVGSVGFQNQADVVLGKIALGDTDGSEHITRLVLSGFAAGVVFKINGVIAGALEQDGTWVITNQAQLDALATTDLTSTMPADYLGSFTVRSVATVTDTATMTGGWTQTASRDFTDTLKIEILPPNDAPTSADKLITINEDTARAFVLADFPFSDSDNDTFAGAKIVSLPTAGTGTLKLGGVAVVAGQVISVADIAAGQLVFVPGSNLSGTEVASFTFQVQDSGGSGGFDQDGVGSDLSLVHTLRFNVTPDADPIIFPTPAGGAITADEGSVVTLPKLDISAGDPSETLVVALSGFPQGAVFSLDGAPIGALDTTIGSPTFGRWVISNASDIAALHDHSLQVTLPQNHDTSFVINVGVTATDTAIVAGVSVTDTSTAAQNLSVTINPINNFSIAGEAGSLGDRIYIGDPGTQLSVLKGFHDNAAQTGRLDLTIQYGADDQVTIHDQYAGNGHSVEFINFNGSTYHDYSFGSRDYLIHTQASGPDDLELNGPPSFSVGNKGVDNILGSSFYDYDDDSNPDTPPVRTVAAGNGGILIGADQKDTLYAGYDSDLLIGGDGADSFKFVSRDFSNRGNIDVIDDFEDGIDKIDLTEINVGVDQPDWVTFASLTAMYDPASNVTTLTHTGLNSATPGYDFSLKFYNQHSLTANDFIFS